MKSIDKFLLYEFYYFFDFMCQEKGFLNKIKRTWYFFVRVYSNTNTFTLYWNGGYPSSSTESMDFRYYHDAIDEFRKKILLGNSSYIELVEFKDDLSINPIFRISI